MSGNGWWSKALNDYLGKHGVVYEDANDEQEATSEADDEVAFVAQWTPIFEKFCDMEGREPYSFQELQDWWDRL